jgi:hypothetical protein
MKRRLDLAAALVHNPEIVHDLTSIAGRALRAVPRDPAAVIPPVFIALFFA